MSKKKKPPLSILVFTEDAPPCPDTYLALCLEWDLISQGKDVRDVLESLARMMVTQREWLDEGKYEAPRPAPNEYYEMYEEAVPCFCSIEFPEPVQIKKVVDDE